MTKKKLRWPSDPPRSWVRARIIGVLSAGRCLLLGKSSAGPVFRAAEGQTWGIYNERGRLDTCESMADLAALILARHSTEEIRAAVEWAMRDEIEASEADRAERETLARLDEAQRRDGARRNALLNTSDFCR